jgi:Uma2 family endonuclease
MSQAAHEPWTVERFFAWQARQPDRYELVGGFPIRMMAGARNAHDAVVINLLAELRNQLRGRKCRPFSGDSSVQTRPDQIRRPDAGVDCGPRDPDGLKAEAPTLVAEVLSPTTWDFDAFEKLEEYKTVATTGHILLVEPNAPEVSVWARRDDRSWQHALIEGLDQRLDLPSLGLSLAMADIYADVDFPARPRLVRRDPDDPAT